VKKVMTKKWIFALFFTLFLTACYDNIAPEDREFVITMGIDKAEDGGYSITLEIPKINALNSKSAEGDTKDIKTATGETLAEAMYNADKNSSKKTYYEQMKVVIFSEEVIQNEELFVNAVFELLENRAISNRILILRTEESAKDIISKNPKEDSMMGLFIANFYKKNKDSAYRVDLDKLVRYITQGQEIEIPLVKT